MNDYKDRVSGWATDIDWSKAPENAKGAIVTKTCNVHHPKIVFASGYHLTGCMIRATAAEDGSPMSAPTDCWDWVDRPAPQWNGEGLPPAGCECEYFAKSENRWIPVVMIGTFRGELVLGCEETGITGQLDSSEYQLRPRRTPAQIAAEEREAAIDEMAGWAGLTGLPIDHERKILGRLYDGNYRRMTKGDDQ